MSQGNINNPIKSITNKVIDWWQKDVYGVEDPPPIERIVITTVELAATIGIMYFLENGTKFFEKLPPEHKKKSKTFFFF